MALRKRMQNKKQKEKKQKRKKAPKYSEIECLEINSFPLLFVGRLQVIASHDNMSPNCICLWLEIGW